METRYFKFKPEEDNYIIKLRNQGKTISEIYTLYNNKYKTLRTYKSIESRIQKLIKSSYTESVDTIIVKYIRLYPTNLQYAFEQASIELNNNKNNIITFNKSQISGRYYSFIRKNYTVLTTGSKEGFVLNVKNTISTKQKEQPKLSSVLFLLKEILNLSDKERSDLIYFLNENN